MILFLRRTYCRLRRHDLAEAWTDLRVDTYCRRCGRLVGRRERLDVVLERFRVAMAEITTAIGLRLDPVVRKTSEALAAFNASLRGDR